MNQANSVFAQQSDFNLNVFNTSNMMLIEYLRWNSDHKKCTEFRTGNDEGVNCGRCIKVCPWNSKESSWFHEAGIWIGSKGEASSKLLKTIDDMFGYGTEQVENYKWWLEWPELYKFKY